MGLTIQLASIQHTWRVSRTVLLGGLLALAACNEPSSRASGVRQPAALEINGFNYTDLPISSFEVNGQGGGNIFVSSPTSGGGGSVCCVSFSPGSPLPLRVKVEWTRDRERWCEQEVLIYGPIPASPMHLGVHFFPDGHIEAEITERYPELKLRLDSVSPGMRKESGNTVADEQTSRCRDGRF